MCQPWHLAERQVKTRLKTPLASAFDFNASGCCFVGARVSRKQVRTFSGTFPGFGQASLTIARARAIRR